MFRIIRPTTEFQSTELQRAEFQRIVDSLAPSTLPVPFVNEARFHALPLETQEILAPFADITKGYYLKQLNSRAVDQTIEAFRTDSPLRALVDIETVKKLVAAISTPINFISAAKFLSWLSNQPKVANDFKAAPDLLIDLCKPENVKQTTKFMSYNLSVIKIFIIRYMFNQVNPEFEKDLLASHHVILDETDISRRIQRLLRVIEDFDLVSLANKIVYKLHDGYKGPFKEANLYNVIMRIFFALDSGKELLPKRESDYFVALYNFVMCDAEKVSFELGKYIHIEEALANLDDICNALPYQPLTDEQVDGMLDEMLAEEIDPPKQSLFLSSSTAFSPTNPLKRKLEADAEEQQRATKLQKTGEGKFKL